MPPIIVISFNRPQLLEPVLESLSAQSGRGLGEREVHLFQDGAVNRYSRIRYAADADIRASLQIFRRYFPAGTVHLPSDNIGICENFRSAEQYIFQERGFDCAYFLEDDLTLSPAYVEMMDRLHVWALAAGNVAYFAAYGDYYVPPQEAGSRRNHQLTTLDHHWGFGLIRRHWLAMQPLLESYYRIILGTDYARRSHQDVFALYERSDTAPRASSQDAAKAIACDRLGLWRANTVVPFAKYIGSVGQHMTPEIYRSVGYDRSIVSETPLDDLRYPDTLEISEKIAEQHRLFVQIRRQEYAGIVAGLQTRKYNPMRLCERQDVLFGYRLFLNQDPDAEEIFRSLVATRTVYEFVLGIADSNRLRAFWTAGTEERHCTREDIIYAYRLCLHRDPESERLFEEHVGKTGAVTLTRAIWNGEERRTLWESIVARPGMAA